MRRWLPALLILVAVRGQAQNLLLNPGLRFHSFDNSRSGTAQSFTSGAVPGWSEDAYGDVQVWRAARITAFRAVLPVENAVVIHPGKRLYQFMLLAEVGLDHGDRVSLSLRGHQTAPGSLQAAIHLMRLDSAAGEWSPAEFGQDDKRTFPRHSRGELVRGPSAVASSGADNDFELAVESLGIVGGFTESADQSSDQPNTIGLTVELTNLSADQDVWVYAPCLNKGATAQPDQPALRPLPTSYRGIPRTIQKLWRGEPLHLVTMGSSIDRGSANPPLYPYDEDPASPTYKQPLAGREFDGGKVGHPEWNDYIGWWQHYFMYTGRLRRALMQKFDCPIDKLLLNVMACDGSSIGESHSGLAQYASLSLAPDANLNGNGPGKSWQELYPSLFARPDGPRPDLVIFGSGANEKIDDQDETAAFEGAIRWFQRHYPGTEFLFCMWQNRESYTRNTGELMELALRYQIPYLDVGRLLSMTTRYCNSYALVPRDGHPQAAAHEIWFRQLERAFDAADPIESGIAQLQLPERANPYTVGWEGEVRSYSGDDPRVRHGTGLILDDTVVNLWASCGEETVTVRLDGEDAKGGRRRPMRGRDVRNSTFAWGRMSLGDRHVVEVGGTDAKLVAVDCKVVPERRWLGVESPSWQLGKLKPEPFASEWGAPYGSSQVVLPAGASATLEVVGTDLSVAYADRQGGGHLLVEVDGTGRLDQATDQAFTSLAGEALDMENRRGIRGLPYGVHTVRATAADGPVALLGLFAYDTRPNRSRERVQHGFAQPGETIRFTLPFGAPPLVSCSGRLTATATADEVTFGGEGGGSYEVVGE